jgi:RNA polymerase sigma-70 factor (ECF subfamily)
MTRARELVDAELLRAVTRGSKAAQARLFFLHREQVAHQLLRMTGDAAAVDDLLQEVFLSVFLALPRFRGDARLTTWIYAITANKVRNWWDATQRRHLREANAPDPEEPPPETPEEALVRKRHRARLSLAFTDLPPKYREAFLARVVEGMTLKEASRALDVGVSTLSYRTRKAEQLLCLALDIPSSR